MDGNKIGRTIELYFVDGRSDGIRTAEVFNWTGHVLMTPRTQIGEALARREARYTGVYLLLGDLDGSALAYVGEAEDIGTRIRSHDTQKEWWSSAVLITSAANNLNKAHVRYLESRLIEIARAAGHVKLDNGNSPGRPSLTEAAISNMEGFLENLLMILPALGVTLFVSHSRPSELRRDTPETPTASGTEFELAPNKHGIHATALLIDGEFVVQSGSEARVEWSSGGDHSYAKTHAELIRLGVLQLQGDRRVFSTNYAFNSPSAAAAVINGRPSNGTIDWRVKATKKTYKQWEAEQLATSSS